MLYYSRSAKGFFHEAVHGPRTLQVPDPDWKPPTIEVVDPDWNRPTVKRRWVKAGVTIPPEGEEALPDEAFLEVEVPDEAAEPDMIEVPDPAAQAPLIDIPNQDCLLPPDATEISDEDHAALMAAQAEGKVIDFTAKGGPKAVDPAPPSADELLAQLRRRRDGLLAKSDWTQGGDAPLTADQVAAWKAWRQQLRDLPDAPGLDPANVAWPVAPS